MNKAYRIAQPNNLCNVRVYYVLKGRSWASRKKERLLFSVDREGGEEKNGERMLMGQGEDLA